MFASYNKRKSNHEAGWKTYLREKLMQKKNCINTHTHTHRVHKITQKCQQIVPVCHQLHQMPVDCSINLCLHGK